jgi:hypothetical protein
MDVSVLNALAKWPNVPDCFGWLALDARGQFRMRNDFAQANGLPGDVVRHDALRAFMYRNYACDVQGRWFFQNGAQRVYVELESTPWVVRWFEGSTEQARPYLETTGGLKFEPKRFWMDEHGAVYVSGDVYGAASAPESSISNTVLDQQVARLHDHDLDHLAGDLTLFNGCGVLGHIFWHGAQFDLEPIVSAELPRLFKFVRHPALNP